jgi:tetratricopeptide (TPR) repeat protein
VGGQLFMAARLVDTDPALALKHAQHAQQLASRVACVRETLAVTAYANEDYQVAKREATTVRRMTGDDSWLAMIADCERGLGRPERAVDLLRSSDLDSMPIADRVEALIVLAGARQDMGDIDAALAVLDGQLLRSTKPAPWLARIRMAYAELLVAAGRTEEAAAWWQRAEQADPDGSTVDPDRLAALEDAVFVDTAEPEPEPEPEPKPEPEQEAEAKLPDPAAQDDADQSESPTSAADTASAGETPQPAEGSETESAAESDATVADASPTSSTEEHRTE